MNKLIWVYDSPFSRSIKWLLLKQGIEHEDYVLTWQQMADDELLAANPKRQVPTLLINNQAKYDSLLIALDYLPRNWHHSIDAKLFRLADSDVEAAIIFLFRANLLKKQFGDSEQSKLMYEAGVNTYKSAVDFLLDHVLKNTHSVECEFGGVLLLSTMLAAIFMAKTDLQNYRVSELKPFINAIEQNSVYLNMIAQYQGQSGNLVPFQFAG
ncbi:glutathione S-transferase N-terminal domain-containing protein [Pseudoalteromonas phenolica]|uniref:glutathione S-transferase N-terminal domain-containing protein n=1 Tax=Pseudoalteromonas phenolica TaxID=161398 RepID=UPI00384ACBDD